MPHLPHRLGAFTHHRRRNRATIAAAPPTSPSTNVGFSGEFTHPPCPSITGQTTAITATTTAIFLNIMFLSLSRIIATMRWYKAKRQFR